MTDDMTITAEGAKINANEKIQPQEFESAAVSTTLEMSIEGVDLTDGIPDDLKKRLYAYERTIQGIVKVAAEERRKEEKTDEEREYEDGP